MKTPLFRPSLGKESFVNTNLCSTGYKLQTVLFFYKKIYFKKMLTYDPKKRISALEAIQDVNLKKTQKIKHLALL